MATPTSSVPRAKAALMRLLAADSTLSQVKSFQTAAIPPDQTIHEYIYLGRPSDGRAASSSQTPKIANQTRVEEYTLYLTIVTARSGYDLLALDTRAFDLLAALELALRADPQLDAFNGGQPIGQPFTTEDLRFDNSNFPALEGGAASQIVVEIDCTAHLRLT